MSVFSLVSNQQFSADGGQTTDIVTMPMRATKGSAGYDFFAPRDLTVEPNSTLLVATGLRCAISEGYCLLILPKSGLGCKYRLGLANTVGLIDSDYYYADNEGHILICLENRGSQTVNIKQGKAYAQGVLLPYGIAQEEEVTTVRTGGFGSTD